jgi:MFS family permease
MHALRPIRSTRWSTFALFLANGFAFGAWATAIPPLKAMLALSAASLSIALLAMAIGGVLAMQAASTVIHHLGGTGRTTLLSSFAFALILTLPLLSPDLPTLIACCAALGATNGIMDVAMNAHAASVERSWGTAIMSSFHAGWSLGGLMGTGFGALLLTLGTPSHILMLPVAALVLGLAFAATPHLGVGDHYRAESETIFRLPERRLIGLAVILMLCFMIEGAMADWSGIYLTTIGESQARAAAGYGAFSALMVGGRLFGDITVRQFGRTLVVGAGCAMAATGLIVATAIPSFITVVAGFALVGAGLSNVVPCVFSTAALRASSPAAGISEVATAGYGGLLGGPPLIGMIAARWGMRSGIGVIAAAASLAAVVALGFRSEKSVTGSRPEAGQAWAED